MFEMFGNKGAMNVLSELPAIGDQVKEFLARQEERAEAQLTLLREIRDAVKKG